MIEVVAMCMQSFWPNIFFVQKLRRPRLWSTPLTRRKIYRVSHVYINSLSHMGFFLFFWETCQADWAFIELKRKIQGTSKSTNWAMSEGKSPSHSLYPVPQMWSIFMWNSKYMYHIHIISPHILEKCLKMWEPNGEFFSPPLLVRIVMLRILQVLLDNKHMCHDHQNTFQTLIHFKH